MASSLFIIPSFGHQKELILVLEQLKECSVLVVDDGSPTPLLADVPLIRHKKNKGYGAAQKTAFSYALSKGFDRIVLVHGDNQYSVSHIKEGLRSEHSYSILLGSRFLDSSQSNIPLWRKVGNRFLTGLVNQRFKANHTDLHTGARVYTKEFLQQLPFFSFSDDFLFDHQLLLWALKNECSIHEFSIPAKYDETVSSISFRRSLFYGLGCMIGIIAPKTR
jgi:glycosyltransferase involved in cell wall biosynthesis